MKRHIIKHHALEISMTDNLESIIDFCCSPRTDEYENLNADNNKPKAGNGEYSEEFTDVESTNEQLPDLGYSDEDKDVEASMETVVSRNHKEDEFAKEGQALEIDLSTCGTEDKAETDQHLDYNGNKHYIDLCTSSPKNLKNVKSKESAAEDSVTELGSLNDGLGSDRKFQHCPQCPFICEAQSKKKCHADIQEDLKRRKRSSWLWDIRKNIKDQPDKTLTMAKLSKREAKETLGQYLNSPLFPTPSEKSPGRKSAAKDEETKDETPNLDKEDLDKETEVVSVIDVKEDKVKGKDRELNDSSREILKEAKENVEELSTQLKREMDMVKEEDYDNAMMITTGSSRGKRYRPYKCSSCPRRSNWRWDIMKHIRKIHPSAKIITLSEDVAKATFSESVMKRPKGQGLKAQRKVQNANKEQEDKSPRNREVVPKQRVIKTQDVTEHDSRKINSVKEIKVKTEESENLKESTITFKKRKLEAEEDKQADVLKQSPRKKQAIPRAFISDIIPKSPKKAKVETIRCKCSKNNTKNKQNIPGGEQLDETQEDSSTSKPILRCLKRYKCYYCPYRSNYRSDIGRHGKRLHRKQQLKVVILDEEEAASTLQAYRQKYARKKFVLAPNTSERGRRKPKEKGKTCEPKNANRPVQDVRMSESAILTKSSKTSYSLSEGAVSYPSNSMRGAKSLTDQQSSRILLDQSNVLSRCCEHGAVECNRNSDINCQTCQIINGAPHMYLNCENASPS